MALSDQFRKTCDGESRCRSVPPMTVLTESLSLFLLLIPRTLRSALLIIRNLAKDAF